MQSSSRRQLLSRREALSVLAFVATVISGSGDSPG